MRSCGWVERNQPETKATLWKPFSLLGGKQNITHDLISVQILACVAAKCRQTGIAANRLSLCLVCRLANRQRTLVFQLLVIQWAPVDMKETEMCSAWKAQWHYNICSELFHVWKDLCGNEVGKYHTDLLVPVASFFVRPGKGKRDLKTTYFICCS